MLLRSWTRSSVLLVLAILVLAGSWTHRVAAQSPFPDCIARTATNATLLLPSSVSIVLDGEEVTRPVHVAVFSPRGTCVGAVKWTGPATSLTVWGKHPNSNPRSGSSGPALAPGAPLHVRLFDPSTGTEYAPANSRITVSFQSDEPYHLTTPRYVPNGIYALDKIQARRRLASREE